MASVLASELWSGANGAAWPAQWTTTGPQTIGATTGSVDIQSNRGRVATPSGDYAANSWAYLSGMSAVVDAEATFDLTIGPSVPEAYFYVGFRAQAAPTSPTKFTSNTGIGVEMGIGTQSWVNYVGVYKADGTGVDATMGVDVPFTYAFNTTYHCRLRVVGSLVAFRIWTGSTEPTAWTTSVVQTDVTAPGKFTIGSTSGGNVGSASLSFSNLQITDGATATPSGPGSSIRYYPRAGFPDRMVGGKFQGSNDFNPAVLTSGTWDTLVTLATVTNAAWNIVDLDIDLKAYKYLRYYDPNQGSGNVAEIEFYTGGKYGFGGTKVVPASIFGTPGSYNNGGATFDKAFDGDTATYFDSPNSTGSILGIVMPASSVQRVIDRWNGSALVRQRLDRWSGSALVAQTAAS
jgi:hypothetical protein